MAAMTYLQMVQQLAQECGVPSAPATCQNQTGEAGRLVDWVNQAHMELQELHDDWNWLMNDFSFTTVAQQQLYTPAAIVPAGDWGVWKPDTFRAFTTSSNYGDEQLVVPVPFDVFRNQYMYGQMRSTYARPVSFAIDPATMGILLGPIPDGTGYTVLGKYFRQPATLVNDLDTPSLPPKFHMAVVYLAMTFYGLFEAAPEILQRGQAGYGKLVAQLEIDQIPGIGFGPALA